jgi:PRD1 phage membrane DNA delivery
MGGNNFMGSMVVILTGIIGVATLAVLVSKNAQTPQVVTSAGSALSNFLAVAVSPVTGGSSGGSNLGLGSGLSAFNLPTLQL